MGRGIASPFFVSQISVLSWLTTLLEYENHCKIILVSQLILNMGWLFWHSSAVRNNRSNFALWKRIGIDCFRLILKSKTKRYEICLKWNHWSLETFASCLDAHVWRSFPFPCLSPWKLEPIFSRTALPSGLHLSCVTCCYGYYMSCSSRCWSICFRKRGANNQW